VKIFRPTALFIEGRTKMDLRSIHATLGNAQRAAPPSPPAKQASTSQKHQLVRLSMVSARAGVKINSGANAIKILCIRSPIPT
jgi:hypothetical protein